MGKKGKLEKFADVSAFPNCFEKTKEMKGNWRSGYFKNDNPIVLELACGKGEYSIGLAQRNPDINYIGVDLKGNRIWKGAKYAMDKGLKNVAFLRIMISNIEEFFAPEEVDEFWIVFPDPQPRLSKRKKRLTHPLFLERYRHISKSGSLMNLKSDSTFFYDFTKEVIEEQQLEILEDQTDVYAWEKAPEYLTEIQTFYENIWLKEGKKIKYLKFRM